MNAATVTSTQVTSSTTVVYRRCISSEQSAAVIIDLAPCGPLRAVLTTAVAGDIRLPAVWRAVCNTLDLASDRVRRVHQRHTRRVVIADDETAPRLTADGMIANTSNQVLLIGVADCLPIFLIADDGEQPALLHTGWRGTGIAADALAYLEHHLDRATACYHAIIGPGIGPCCYEVPAERAIRFRNRFGSETAEISSAGSHIDLRAANVGLLSRAGVRLITVYEDCTACSPALISFRADRAAGYDGTRRMAALLGSFGGVAPQSKPPSMSYHAGAKCTAPGKSHATNP